MLPEDDTFDWDAHMDRLTPGSRQDLDQMLPTDMGLSIGKLITTGASGNFTRLAREMGLPVEFWAFSSNRKHRNQLCKLLCGVVLSAGAQLHTRPGQHGQLWTRLIQSMYPLPELTGIGDTAAMSAWEPEDVKLEEDVKPEEDEEEADLDTEDVKLEVDEDEEDTLPEEDALPDDFGDAEPDEEDTLPDEDEEDTLEDPPEEDTLRIPLRPKPPSHPPPRHLMTPRSGERIQTLGQDD